MTTSTGYPPTHRYRIEKGAVVADSLLAERARLIGQLVPGFFSGARFLDVACAKGYFSLAFAGRFEAVEAIDVDPGMIAVAEAARSGLGIVNVKFHETSFRSYHSPTRFDRVFIGNGPHHLFREIGGHEWISKVAALCSDQLVTEGPLDRSCQDIADWPAMYDSFVAEMSRWFTLENKVPASSYTPGRFVCSWRRKPFVAPPETIRKTFRTNEWVANDPVTILVAASSPFSNGLVGLTPDGWLEARSNERPFLYRCARQVELFRRHCQHQRFLSRVGYVDLDPATINFFKGSLRVFDKDAVVPVSGIRDNSGPLYRLLFNYSYDRIAKHHLDRAVDAINSRDAAVIERCFTQLSGEVA